MGEDKQALNVCQYCGKPTYLPFRCPYCGGALRVPHPPRFSPDDKYVKYRYMLRIISNSGE